MIIFKNMFSFGLTFKAYAWLVANQTNATPVFNPIASVQLVICLTSIPLCKSWRTQGLCLLHVHSNIRICRYLRQASPQLFPPTRYTSHVWC